MFKVPITFVFLDRIVLIMNRGSRTSQMIDLINLQQNRLNHIMPN
ncbi:hypothetical protein HanXRQr2_Chr14g0658101 [Helianthus annuus]|uniref:Uncharacterized protein n=1 Tax=Helianthus annuus TaxID=4232 RepID=A0A9K3ECG2_HELAN|nr:hypothetical protein HanXRQr2_Chr14g0658101 [Helianthus annuus]